MAQIGLFVSICNILCLCSNPLSVWIRRYPVCVIQNVSSVRGKQRFSGIGIAQNPCRSVRSGMAREHMGPVPGGTLVRPSRSAPCHSATERSMRMRTFSPTCSGRLLKVTPWWNDCGFLVARRSPALSFMCCPLTWGWKVSGPRQLFPHVHWRQMTRRNTGTDLICKLMTIVVIDYSIAYCVCVFTCV